jgi:hypothetical protein
MRPCESLRPSCKYLCRVWIFLWHRLSIRQRQFDVEHGFTRPTRDRNRAAVPFDDRLGDRETHPTAARTIRSGQIDLVKPIEDAGEVLGGIPSPVSVTVI